METFDDFLEHNHYTHKLERHLSKKRYEHTLRVARVAHNLAHLHGYNSKKAVVAALLHDCAKNYTEHHLIHECEKHNLKLSHAEKDNPELLHAKVGAIIAKEHYHIDDSDILNAIRYHTTGRPNMSVLEKIVYISDYIEPKRKHKGNLELIRKTAKHHLDEAMYLILEETLTYLKKKSKTKDPLTKETFKYYQTLVNTKGIVYEEN